MKMQNFLNETANFGTTGALAKATKRTYQGQTITDMRQDIVTRAQQTIKALESYQGGQLRAPMARSIRNGLCVKIGYGKRNVGFFEKKTDKDAKPIAIIPSRNFARGEAFIAAAYLRKVVNLVSTGEFDALLAKTLADMVAKFPKKDVPNKKKTEVTNNVTNISNAA
jgi:hypothetical protein